MKVLIVVRTHDNTPSGGRKIVYSYANYLVSHGHEVKLCFVGDTPFRNRKHNFLKRIIHCYRFSKVKGFQTRVTWFNFDPRVELDTMLSINVANVEKYDVIVAFDFLVLLSLMNNFEQFSYKFVHFIQSDERIYDSSNLAEDSWKADVQNIVVSSSLFELVSHFSPRVALVQNYTETDRFFVENAIEKRGQVVSLINHPNPSKRSVQALEVLKQVRAVDPNLRIIMFGNGPRPEKLGEHDKYFQRADTETLRSKVYNQSAVYLQMSENEGWGLTATEAMACGCALVSAENGGVKDFATNRESALTFKVDDISSAVNCVQILLNDENLRMKLAINGRRRVVSFQFSKSANEFESVLQKIANESSSIR